MGAPVQVEMPFDSSVSMACSHPSSVPDMTTVITVRPGAIDSIARAWVESMIMVIMERRPVMCMMRRGHSGAALSESLKSLAMVAPKLSC
jgi:hypothetical protein